jgi:hypothetical protein
MEIRTRSRLPLRSETRIAGTLLGLLVVVVAGVLAVAWVTGCGQASVANEDIVRMGDGFDMLAAELDSLGLTLVEYSEVPEPFVLDQSLRNV